MPLPPGTNLRCCRRLHCPGPTPFCLVPPPSSPCVSYLAGSCRRKESAERCQRKNNRNLTINQILPFVIPNLSPVTRNGDGGETTDEGQREAKRRGRKHEHPAELTFLSAVVFVVAPSVSKVDREGAIDATVFRIINFPTSIWLDLTFSYLHVQTVQKSILPNEKGKCQIELMSN